MTTRRLMTAGLLTLVFLTGYALGTGSEGGVAVAVASDVSAVQATQVFELRTYTAAEGKYDALLARFRDHTLRIFEKHGMSNVGYWMPQDAPLAGNTLVYLLAHPSREAAEQSWRAFGADPEWQQVFAESRADGALIAGLERVFMDPTDFSPMR